MGRGEPGRQDAWPLPGGRQADRPPKVVRSRPIVLLASELAAIFTRETLVVLCRMENEVSRAADRGRGARRTWPRACFLATLLDARAAVGLTEE